MTNVYGQECWAISFNKYFTAAVTNVESILEKRVLRFPPKFVTSFSCGYFPDIYVTVELKEDSFQCYQ